MSSVESFTQHEKWANHVDPDRTDRHHRMWSDQYLHCLLLIQQFIDTSEGSKTDLFKIKDKYVKKLMLRMLGKNFSRRRFEIFFLFFPENRIYHFLKINLHEISNPIFWEK